MGFETQEEAERWAENMEFRADQRKDDKMLHENDVRFAVEYEPTEQGHIARLEAALEWAAKNFDMIASIDLKHGRHASAALSAKQAKECRDAIAAR